MSVSNGRMYQMMQLALAQGKYPGYNFADVDSQGYIHKQPVYQQGFI